MAARGHAGLVEPRCTGSLQSHNGTCVEQLGVFPPFSSTLALIVLVLVLVGIILVSLATFHFHKRKLRKRKILRAQEEYERDRRSPARASGNELVRPCVIVRPLRCEDQPRGQREESPGPSEQGPEPREAPSVEVPIVEGPGPREAPSVEVPIVEGRGPTEAPSVEVPNVEGPSSSCRQDPSVC